MAKQLTKDNFKSDVLDSPLPAIIDFWATWCMPCKMIAPVVDEIAKEYEGKLIVGKVNVDEAGEIAQQYSIMSIPTLLFIKGGQVVDSIIGLVPKEHIMQKIKAAFGEI
jgi:thioredoxin 1